MNLSVIIPTLDEAERLPATLASMGHPAQIIIADGGSTDTTAKIARAHGAIVIDAPRGRALQMNAGARAATGDVLLFLHADTRLPDNYAEEVDRILSLPGVAAGAFKFQLDRPTAGMRWIERMVDLRSRWLAMPYGDQGLFMAASTFHDVGGFPNIPIMEDYELVRRLKRRGRVQVSRRPIITSARRWQRNGVLKSTLTNQITVIAYRVGISPSRIAAWRK